MVYRGAIHRLVAGTYLKPSTVLSHVSPKDKQIKYEAEEKAKISGFPTAKELREAKQVAEARLRREEEEAEKVGLVSIRCTTRSLHKERLKVPGQKRKAGDQPVHRARKRKLDEDEDVVDVSNGGLFPVSDNFINISLQETVYFRVNFDKFNVHIRNNVSTLRTVFCSRLMSLSS